MISRSFNWFLKASLKDLMQGIAPQKETPSRKDFTPSKNDSTFFDQKQTKNKTKKTQKKPLKG